MAYAISAGESFNLQHLSPSEESPIRLTDLTTKAYKTRLPPAVVTVPPDHIRGYVHTKKVNHYLVGSSLGEGSFAKVKEAFHILVGEKVAMKVIDKKKALQDPYVAKNFRREAKLLQMVRHQNILQLLEVIETDSSFYLITELCSGGELMKYIYKKGHLDEIEVRKFMRQIVSAVDHLHRAGIIHRDLKVENMLLDGNMDIKIIDFGLSNEEFIQGENGITHCTTQCGSPAYAAPELLGHKSYGPQVDIWSMGVNMYAMLTGCLPYTVEPFNITALHAKMLENKMNPIPDHISANCKDLLKKLLKSNPDERVKMTGIINHPWMNEDHALPFGPARFPNKLDVSDLNSDIIQHMVYIIKVKDGEEDLKQELVSNRATHSAAVYHLLAARLARYKKHFESSSSRVRRKPIYERDDEDRYSVASMPTRLKTKQSSRGGNNNHLRQNRPAAGKSRPTSHPPGVEEEPEVDPKLPSRHFERRQTMPEMMLKEDFAKLQQKRGEVAVGKQDGDYKHSKRPSTRQNINGMNHPKPQPSAAHVQRQRRPSPPTTNDHYRYSAPAIETNSTLAPLVRPPHTLQRAHCSTPSALNVIRDDLSKALPNHTLPNHHGGPPMQAWHSNPSSRNASRNPSRQGSRQSSSHTPRAAINSTAVHTRNASYDANDASTMDTAIDDLEFHRVRAHTLPRQNRKANLAGSSESIAENSGTIAAYLPAITEMSSTLPSSWNRKRHRSETSPEKRNGYTPRSSSETVEVRTELSMEEVVTEILRAAHGLKAKEVDKVGAASVMCTWGGLKMLVVVIKDRSAGFYKLNFQCLSGDVNSCREKCDKLSKKLKL